MYIKSLLVLGGQTEKTTTRICLAFENNYLFYSLSKHKGLFFSKRFGLVQTCAMGFEPHIQKSSKPTYPYKHCERTSRHTGISKKSLIEWLKSYDSISRRLRRF